MKRKCETMQTVGKMMMVNDEEMWRVRMGCGSARQGIGRNIVKTTIFTHTFKKWQQHAFKHADLFRYVGAEFVLWTLVLVIITLMDIRTADGHEKRTLAICVRIFSVNVSLASIFVWKSGWRGCFLYVIMKVLYSSFL